MTELEAINILKSELQWRLNNVDKDKKHCKKRTEALKVIIESYEAKNKTNT